MQVMCRSYVSHLQVIEQCKLLEIMYESFKSQLKSNKIRIRIIKKQCTGYNDWKSFQSCFHKICVTRYFLDQALDLGSNAWRKSCMKIFFFFKEMIRWYFYSRHNAVPLTTTMKTKEEFDNFAKKLLKLKLLKLQKRNSHKGGDICRNGLRKGRLERRLSC